MTQHHTLNETPAPGRHARRPATAAPPTASRLTASPSAGQRLVAGGLFLLAATSTTAHAQTVDDQARLDDLQVTANRLVQTQSDVLASTTVIERAEIERSQASSLVELLQGRAGIELARNGGRGNTTSLFMRGTNSDHTLVLVDGQRIASPTDGSVNWEFLPVAAIERIEIVRGPRASAFGADAIGGVINIFTRSADAPGQHATLELRAGEQDSQQQSGWFSTVQGDTRLSALLDHAKSDGFSARDDASDDDGFAQNTGQLSLSHAFGESADLDVSLLRSTTRYDYDDCAGSDDCRGKGEQFLANAALTSHLSDSWDMVLTAGQARESRRQIIDSDSNGRTATRRNDFGIAHRFHLDDGGAALGVDYRQEELTDGASSYAHDARENYGLYANAHRQLGRHSLSAGARFDDDQRFGDATTGNVAYAFDLTARQQLGASYATAFRAPSFLELYGPYGNNPELDAEESETTEVFWRLTAERWHLGVTAFDTRIDDLISYTGPDFAPINVDRARIRGVELSTGWQTGGLSLDASLTHQNPEDRSTDERLLRRARTYGRLDADYAFAGYNVGATLRSAGNRRDTDVVSFGETHTAGYGVVDLRTSWAVTPEVTLLAKLENAFDRDYQLVDGYNTQGRYFEAGVRLTY
ncbi:TonB-dependent receptor domain-containing protein [Salinicola halophilus]|uniref:TonB-dependent receptor domain-containing protein n=1 Tax=Salinicola halophilus TaxID=184065 RepID=UPI0013A66236|nr:TonB-dependent receptor [Salinicola halophilus]